MSRSQDSLVEASASPRLGRRLALSLAGGGLLPLPALRTAHAATPVRVTLPGAGSAGSVWRPLIAEFGPEALEGIDIEWVGGNPGQVQVQLITGAVDVGVFGALGLAETVTRGSDIVIFGPALNNHGRWVVRGDSPVREPADLVGKRVATQPETSETYKQARIAASLYGIDLKRDLQVVFGPPTANLALFERGDVDGVIVLEPIATRLVGSGAREIARVGDMWQQGTLSPARPFLVGLAAQRRWLEVNRPVAERLARVFVRANRVLNQDPVQLSRLHGALGIPDREQAAIGLLPERMGPVYATEWNTAVWTEIDRQVTAAADAGLIPARPTRPLYDPTHIEGI